MQFKILSLRSCVIAFLLPLAGCQTSAPREISRESGHPEFSNAELSAHSWLEINKRAFESNIRTMQTLIGDQVKICAVLKADAYGHGMALLMPSIIALNVSYVCITSNREAEIARNSGYTGHIVRLRNATLGELEEALRLDVEELIGNLAFAQAASELARKHHRTLRYHLSLNSGGMSRNDLEMKRPQARSEVLAMLKLPSLQIVGIMTHFPVEDVVDVRKGLATFNEESSWIIENGKLDRSKLLLHTANSFTTLSVPEARLDLVRPGGALYGDTIPERKEYQRVMQFKSRVAVVNSYPAGNTVNYDRTYTLKRDSRLANIPVGYSDGYRRAFSNRGLVLIRGKRFPIVGRVTMNTIMVDVTDASDVRAGDEVVLFGHQGKAEITQDEMEKQTDSILPDLYTVWGNSNPKILVDE